MSQYVNVAHLNTYSNRVEALLQQRGSYLKEFVTVQSYVGKGVRAVDQIGASVASEITVRHSRTELTDIPHDARWCHPRDFGVAHGIDKEDLQRMMIDVQSPYAMAQSYALGRTCDDLSIEAMITDAAKTGEDGEVTTTLSADGVGIVDSAGADPMTVAKLREAKKNLMANEVDIRHEQLFVGLTAVQHDNMLSQTQAVNLDYTDKPVLVDGSITKFMGFNFVHCERFTLNSSGKRICPVWAKSGVILGMWNSLEVSIDKLPERWNMLQIMSKGTFGATRTEGGKIQHIICDE